jgi:transcriptional regulator GlxA family with amidase domain
MERINEERINRLFELRDEARHQFAQSVSIVPEKISTNKEEEKLVEKLLKSIGENMDNIDYTVDQMASDIAMSRANLYKKTQQMLGITPNEFLRNVRLKHAASLLEQTDMPVNQISLIVGFQTARYFSQCFRQMFGVTPTEYRNGEVNQTIN